MYVDELLDLFFSFPLFPLFGDDDDDGNDDGKIHPKEG